ncbi:hypothetical protein ACTXT7_001237 [Hymenolepis weldensis]
MQALRIVQTILKNPRMYAHFAALLLVLAPLSSFGSFDVSDEFIFSIVWEPESNSKSDDASSMLIKTPNNETYLCHLPAVTKSKHVTESLDFDKHPQLLFTDFFETNPCIFKVEGYWTYELCHGKHIRQFRAEGSGPKTTRVIKEFYLGRVSESETHLRDKEEELKKEDEEESKESKPKSIHINGRDFAYYPVEYVDGTECDLTGLPRKATVAYVCLEESGGELFQISELETCVYQLIVFTRHLCSYSRYNSHKLYSNPITCVSQDKDTHLRPVALDALEKEKEEMISLSEDEHLEGIFGALRVKGLKVEKIDNQGNVMYRVRTVDPLETQQDGETLEGEQEGASPLPSPPAQSPVVSPQVMKELRQAQRRELQSFLAGRTCLTGGAGWWRHEVCYGGSITQYHEDPETGNPIVITLGKWNEDAHLKWISARNLLSPLRFSKITQFYSDGDYCGEIKARRTVRCQVKVSTKVQLSFSEPSTCQYSISLESPLFCDLLKLADENGLFPSGVEVSAWKKPAAVQKEYRKHLQLCMLYARFRRISSANQGEVIHQMTDETSANLKGNQAEVTHTCRGTINLANAKIVSAGHLTLVISNSSTQTFHLKATNEMEQKKWMAALTMGKANALSLGKSGNDSDDWDEADDDESDLAWSAPRLMPEDAARLVEGAISNFESRINDLQHYQDTLKRKADDLQKVINDLEGSDIPSNLAEKISIVQDRATVYKVASLAMANSCSDFLGFARSQMRRWRKIFNTQVERRARLEQMVEESHCNVIPEDVVLKSMDKRNNCLISKKRIWYVIGVDSGNWGIPGQAVAVRRTSAEAARARAATLSSNHGNSVRLTTDGSSSGPLGISSAIASEDEEDDFYDAAEDAGADEFDVILPSTNPCPYPGPLSQTAAEKEGMVDARQSPTSDVPVGADINMEYESDIEDSDTDDQRKGQLENRAHVIQKHAWGKAGRSPKETSSSSYAGPSRSAPEKRIIPVRKPVQRRTSIPPKPNISLNLWSFLSNCIGKELTKIPMPVNFSEPLSMLQRLSENFEYSYVLDRAAACTNPLEQLAHVSAFVVSSYASTALRVAKPFNPLLNETYECDRTDDLGWRSVAEQALQNDPVELNRNDIVGTVSHHPPVAAFHCESDLWYTWFDFSISTKFRGRYLQIKVNGVCHLVFRKTGYHYTWTKIPLTVHNIIVGRLWIENSGEIDIINHTTGDKCHLTFKQYSYFSSEVPRRSVNHRIFVCEFRSCGVLLVRGSCWCHEIDAHQCTSSDVDG